MENTKKIMSGILLATMCLLIFASCTNQNAESSELNYREHVENQLIGNDLGLETLAEISEIISLDIVDVNEDAGIIKGKAVCRTMPNLSRSTIKNHYYFDFEIPYSLDAKNNADKPDFANIASVIFLDQFDNQ